MDKKTNFNATLNDFFGIGKNPPTEKDRTSEADSVSLWEPVYASPADEKDMARRKEKSAYPERAPLTEPTRTPGVQTTIITSDVVIEGNISSLGHVDMAGQLKGDMTIKGDAKISGKIDGNVNASSVNLLSCNVRGNLHAEARVALDHGAQLIGNIEAVDLICDGKIQGDLDVSGSVYLKKNTVLYGNMKAGSLAIEEGVMLKGAVEVIEKKDFVKDFTPDSMPPFMDESMITPPAF